MKITCKIMIKTLLAYLVVAIVGAICFIPCFCIACLPERLRRDNRVYYFFAYLFCWTIMHILMLPKKFTGFAKINEQPSLIVANHQSSLDIPMVSYLIGTYPHVWLVLSYYAHHPVLGVFVRRMNIPVDTSNSRQAARALLRILSVARGTKDHIVIFPEGTRHADGQVHEFFDGYALIAQKTKRPVIPIYLKNNYKIFPPYAFWAGQYPLQATVGPLFFIEEHETPQAFNTRIHSWFLEQSRQQLSQKD